MKKPILTGVAIFLGLVLLGWVFWGFGVLVSGPKGQGEAIKTKNSSANWTAAQAKFEELYAGIQSADEKTENAAVRLAANPKDLTLQQTHAGVQSGCVTLVNDYNAESRKFLSADFKSVDLPYKIDRTDPAFDCK